MTVVYYDPKATMLAARSQYFAVNKFGDDGGYSDTWVDFKLGPIPFPFPNTPARVRAVRFHDLHHILTGYDTNFLGEIEIAGWELGAGCKNFVAAWMLNLGAISVFWLAPRRVFGSFVRGLRSKSLYGEDLDGLLKSTVREARAQMQVPETTPAATASDYVRFGLAVAAGIVVGSVMFSAMVPLAPIGLVTNYLKSRDEARGKRKQTPVAATAN